MGGRIFDAAWHGPYFFSFSLCCTVLIMMENCSMPPCALALSVDPSSFIFCVRRGTTLNHHCCVCRNAEGRMCPLLSLSAHSHGRKEERERRPIVVGKMEVAYRGTHTQAREHNDRDMRQACLSSLLSPSARERERERERERG